MFKRNTVYMETQEKIYQIALSQVRGIGYTLAQRLMAHFGSAQAVFQSTPPVLRKALGNSSYLAPVIHKSDGVAQANELLTSHTKANIHTITPWEAAYSERLKQAC